LINEKGMYLSNMKKLPDAATVNGRRNNPKTNILKEKPTTK
jgi:hypothetical protein